MSHDPQTQEASEIKTGAPDTVLAGLWWRIKKDLNIDDAKVEDLIFKYANTETERTLAQRAQLRGNLRGELSKETMTWDTFTKAMRVIRASGVVLTFKLHHLRLVSTHCVVLDMNGDEDTADKKKPNQMATFFRDILNDLGINANIFEKLLNSYMVRARIPVTAATRTSVRGNLKKELLGPKLSWKSFIKGLSYLCVTQFELIAVIEYKSGHTTTHNRTIVLNDIEDFSDDKELLENINL